MSVANYLEESGHCILRFRPILARASAACILVVESLDWGISWYVILI